MMMNNNMMNMMMSNNIMNNNVEMMNNKMNMNYITNDNIAPMINNMKMNNQLSNIEVIFRKANKVTSINCKLSEKISEIIQKYREKSSDYETNVKFIFNARELKNQSLTVNE